MSIPRWIEFSDRVRYDPFRRSSAVASEVRQEARKLGIMNFLHVRVCSESYSHIVWCIEISCRMIMMEYLLVREGPQFFGTLDRGHQERGSWTYYMLGHHLRLNCTSWVTRRRTCPRTSRWQTNRYKNWLVLLSLKSVVRRLPHKIRGINIRLDSGGPSSTRGSTVMARWQQNSLFVSESEECTPIQVPCPSRIISKGDVSIQYTSQEGDKLSFEIPSPNGLKKEVLHLTVRACGQRLWTNNLDLAAHSLRILRHLIMNIHEFPPVWWGLRLHAQRYHPIRPIWFRMTVVWERKSIQNYMRKS